MPDVSVSSEFSIRPNASVPDTSGHRSGTVCEVEVSEVGVSEVEVCEVEVSEVARSLPPTLQPVRAVRSSRTVRVRFTDLSCPPYGSAHR